MKLIRIPGVPIAKSELRTVKKWVNNVRAVQTLNEIYKIPLGTDTDLLSKHA